MEGECAICLQQLLYPVTLPCNHIFCFLCVKGIRTSSNHKKCALCRVDFTLDAINVQHFPEKSTESTARWFYSARGNGWWEYDERTSRDIEEAFQAGDKTQAVISIGGFIYTVDFEALIQYRSSDPSRHRKIKRETSNSNRNSLVVKGVAGLRIRLPENVSEKQMSANRATSSEGDSSGSSNQVTAEIDQLGNRISNVHLSNEASAAPENSET